MMNEIIFILQTLMGLFIVLFAFRLGESWVYATIGIFIVLANIFVTKTITLFGFEATGGNVLYGAIFLSTDLLSEHYGKESARKGVLIGFMAAFIFLIMSQFITAYTASSSDWGASAAMDTLFGLSPSIVIASLAAYLASQLHDVWAFTLWKKRFDGKYLWLRNNLSTIVSQFIDTIIFCFLAFVILPPIISSNGEIFPMDILLDIIITTFVLKVMVALLDTPFIYLSHYFKPKELQ